jgi:cellulose biosynthesis protein BcsQ
MKTIVFAATKGGTGKSSLAYNVAIAASKRHQVLIADLDPQRSLKAMWERRGELLNPRLVSNVQNLGSRSSSSPKPGMTGSSCSSIRPAP